MASANYGKLPCEEERTFPANQETRVIINYIEEDGSMWVMMESEVESLAHVSTEINLLTVPVNAPTITVDKVYAVLHRDLTWYRGRVLSNAPEILVQFIDYGDKSTVSLKNIAPLPHDLCSYSPLAMKIALPADSTFVPQEGLRFKVRSVCKREDLMVVDVANETEKQPTESKAFSGSISGSIDSDFKEDNISTPFDEPNFEQQGSEGCGSSESENQFVAQVSEEVQIIDGNSFGSADYETSGPTTTLWADHQHSLGSEGGGIPCGDSLESNGQKSSSARDSKIVVEPLEEAVVSEKHEGSVPTIVTSEDNCFEAAPVVGGNITFSIVENESATNTGHVDASSSKLEISDFDCIVFSEHVSHSTIGSELIPNTKEHLSYVEVEDASKSRSFGNSVISNPEAVSEKSDLKMESNEYKLQSDSELTCDDYSNQTTQQKSFEERDVEHKNDSFISALGRYPHLGGGYSNESAAEPFSHSKSNDMDDMASYGPMSQKGFPGQTFSQVSKNSFPQGNKPVHSQVPQNNIRPSHQKNINVQSVNSSKTFGHHQTSDATLDFKNMLDFELSIIREQHRLQLLQIQKKTDEQISMLVRQVNTLSDDMARQFSIFRNEVNSKLLVMNDALVQKIAQSNTDLDLLKNEMEIKNLVSKSMDSSNPQNQSLQLNRIQPQNVLKNFKGQSSQLQHQFSQAQQVKSGSSDFFCSTDNQQQYSPLQEHSSRDASSFPENRLMSIRKEKMAERDQSRDTPSQQSYQHQQPFNNFEQNGKNPVFHQNNSSCYPKMDHFDPLKTGLDTDAQSSNKSGCIICVANLAESIKPDTLFNLFGVYGNVQRIKISNQDKGKAFIEMADRAQAEAVMLHLDGVPFMDRRLRVTPCGFSQLKLSRPEFQSNTCKDYTKPNSLKLHRFKTGSWNSQKLYPPSETLMVSNVLKTVTDDKIKEEFAKNGFHVKSISTQNCKDNEKKLVFLAMGSTAEAINALSVMHLKELADWMMMRISFGKRDKRLSESQH